MSDSCQYKEACGGCSEWGKTYEKQLEAKKKYLLELLIQNSLPEIAIQMYETSRLGLRERVDLSYAHGRLGFYHKNVREVVDIDECLLLTNDLNSYYKKIHAIFLKYQTFLENKKISLRLRTGAKGDFGVWIDTAHVTVKEMMDEKEFLCELLSLGLVEIGQKHKPLMKDETGTLKLSKESNLHSWIQTYDKNLTPINLYSTIGAFSQPGRISNRVMMEKMFELLKDVKIHSAVEFFSGMGNFTLPILSLGAKVKSFELSENAFLSIEKSLEKYPAWKEALTFETLNLYEKTKRDFFSKEDLLIVDPPRSGLGFILEQIEATAKEDLPARILYISCMPESFAYDLSVLTKLGYKTDTILGIDQFPYSKHSEWMTLLVKA